MIICGTGHRPHKLGGYGDDVKDVLIRLAIDSIPEGTTKVISGMALGWDMALARGAISRGLPFIAAIPFRGQESIWPYKAIDEYNEILDYAEEVVVVAKGGYAAWKMQLRNEYMVNHSDCVLALWDGSSGGTANCIKYAEKINKPVINLWKSFNE